MATKPDPNTTLVLNRDFKAERERVFGAFRDAHAASAGGSDRRFKENRNGTNTYE